MKKLIITILLVVFSLSSATYAADWKGIIPGVVLGATIGAWVGGAGGIAAGAAEAGPIGAIGGLLGGVAAGSLVGCILGGTIGFFVWPDEQPSTAQQENQAPQPGEQKDIKEDAGGPEI